MATFTFQPDYGAKKKVKPRVLKMQFGDGYEQRQAEGLNTKLKEWSLTFKRGLPTLNTIDTFLLARGAVESFNWTDPEGYAGVWVCDEWDSSIDNLGWGTLTATFREVPETAAP